MAISMAYLKTLTDAVNMISGAGQNVAEATLRRLIDAGDYANPHDLVKDALKELEPLFQEVSERTASISATSYDLLRSEALGEGMGALAYPDRAEEWTRKAMYAAAAQSNDDMDAFIRAVRARLDYEAKRAAGTTMFANGAADRARPRFARVPTGAETCPFCIMLASRGFVYWSSESAGKLDHYHSHCDCRVVPQFGGESYEGYDPDEYLREYERMLNDGDLDSERLAESARRAKKRSKLRTERPAAGNSDYLRGIRADGWKPGDAPPKVEYESPELEREIRNKRPHEARTAERLSENGIVARFVRDVRREVDPSTRQTRNVGLPDLDGGIELKWLDPARTSLRTIDRDLRKASQKEGLEACVIDNCDAKLPDGELIAEVRKRMEMRGVRRVIVVRSDGSIVLLE